MAMVERPEFLSHDVGENEVQLTPGMGHARGPPDHLQPDQLVDRNPPDTG